MNTFFLLSFLGPEASILLAISLPLILLFFMFSKIKKNTTKIDSLEKEIQFLKGMIESMRKN